MAKAKVVELVALECVPCSEGSNGVHLRNYTTTKNRRTVQGKLELKKYCPRCRAHVRHRETRVK
jgi:large subunit ribosomal protein L33